MVAYINRRICIYLKTHIHAYIYPLRIFIFFIGGVFFIRGQDYLNTFFFKNGVFRILLEIFMGFSFPKGGKQTRSIRIKHRYIFNIFVKNAFWTKNSAFDFKKKVDFGVPNSCTENP